MLMLLDRKNKWEAWTEGNADRITPRGKALDCVFVKGKYYKNSDLSEHFE